MRKFVYGRFDILLDHTAFQAETDPTIVQYSGGRTSAFLAALSDERAILAYENTGREHEKTLEFVQRVGDACGKQVLWLEFRPPARKGAPPKEFSFEIVSFETAARKGEPFEEMMRCINDYRREMGKGTISPWVNSRICTTHLKHRVLDHYLASIGVVVHDRWLGLRADEPDRVRKLGYQETRDKGLAAPLSTAGITKADVMEFWSMQSFDLGLVEYEGNCDGCFLKDQADRSRAIGANPEAVAYWSGMQKTYPSFGGRDCVPYTQLAHELPTRLAIESALREGKKPEDDGRLETKRFRLVMRQEERRWREGAKTISCACEGSMGGGNEEEDLLNL